MKLTRLIRNGIKCSTKVGSRVGEEKEDAAFRLFTFFFYSVFDEICSVEPGVLKRKK